MANQYANLLAEVTGQGQYGINTATSAEAALMAQRGQLGVNGQTQISQAQQGAETTAAANEGSIQTAAAGAQAGIAEDIAGIQTGAAGTNLNYGLNVGSLAQQLALAQLPYTSPAAAGVAVPSGQSLAVPSTVANSIKFLTPPAPGGGGGGNTGMSNEVVMNALRILMNKNSSGRKPQASISRFVS